MIETTICYIGGGSADWAVKLMRDLALEQGLTGSLRLYDIDPAAAEVNRKLGEQLFVHQDAQSRFQVTVEESPEAALKGSDIVILSIEPGPTQCRYADLEIPGSYGILQSVGDTIGPGGALRAWRAVPIFVDYARQIAQHCPDAWVINYTNPMTLCTMALYHGFPDIKAVGCCHEVIALRKHLIERLSEISGGQDLETKDLRIDLTGVNHFTFASAVEYKGTDVLEVLKRKELADGHPTDLSEHARQRKAEEKWFDSDHRIAADFLMRFGAYGMAGDRHLAEFVPWYLSSEEELERYGVVLTPYAWRMRRWKEREQRNPDTEAGLLEPSGEEGVAMIRALLGGDPMTTNVNVPNRGQISWLPEGHPVETFARISTDAYACETPKNPPPGLQALVRRVVDVQQRTFDACLSGDPDILLEAFLMDSLVHLPIHETQAMMNQMLAHLESIETSKA